MNIQFEKRMGPIDAGLWAIEQDPLMRSTMVCVSLVDGPPDRSRLTETVERATWAIPRLRQRVAATPFSVATPEFVDDENFDLAYHLRWLRAPGDRTLQDIFDFAGPFAMAGFDRDRPLWEFVIFDDLVDGQAAFVQKMHHSIIDGVGAVKMSLALMDREPIPAERPAYPRPIASAPRTPRDLLIDGVRDRVRGQIKTARHIAALAGDFIEAPAEQASGWVRGAASLSAALRPTPTPLSPVMLERSHSVRFDGVSVSLPLLKEAAKSVGCRVNDGFVAAVLGGFDRYHGAHGVEAPELRMTMPVSTRGEGKVVEGGNHLAFARFPVPLSVRDPKERMQHVHTLVANRRDDASLGVSAAALGIVGRYPAKGLVTLFGSLMRGGDIVTSNVPGSPTALYLGGAQILANFAFGPLSGHAVNLTLLSYCEEAHISVGMDPAAVPDQDVLLECLRAGFDEVIGCRPS